MRLPHISQATIDERKIREYLLSLDHRDGCGKAKFFLKIGFKTEKWEAFREALLIHAKSNPVKNVVTTSFGTRYIVQGMITSPDGQSHNLCTVWFIETGESAPRLVTAYPQKRRKT
ncbi:MAG: hypothetical protein NTW14_08530 [bacterium]|nr:hypothetical protein [bacterium]